MLPTPPLGVLAQQFPSCGKWPSVNVDVQLSGSSPTSSSPCGTLLGQHDGVQEEVTTGDPSNMALEQRGPPQEELSLSSPPVRSSWGDGPYPTPLGPPTAYARPTVLHMPTAPLLTVHLTLPLTDLGQSEAGSDSEGEYVELEELPSLSPHHSVTQGFCYQNAPGHTAGPAPASETQTPEHTSGPRAGPKPCSAAHIPGLATHTPEHTPDHTPGPPMGSETHTPDSATHTLEPTPGPKPGLATHTSGHTPSTATQTPGLETHTVGLTPVPATQSRTTVRATGGPQPDPPCSETQNHSSVQHPTTSSTQNLPNAVSHQPAEERGMLKEPFREPLKDSLKKASSTASLTEKLTTNERRRLPVNSHVMSRGVLCLPGSRDRRGAAVVTVWTNSSIWWRCSCRELLDVFLYFSSISRKDVLALGLTVLVDVRSSSLPPLLTHTLCYLQKHMPGLIHSVLLLAERDDLDMDRPSASQVVSLKCLQRYVDVAQLPAEMNGSFCYCHQRWLCFRSRVEKMTRQCEDVISLLQRNILFLESSPLPLSKEAPPLPHSADDMPLPQSTEEVQVLLARYRCVMSNVLQHSQLVDLQKEGGAALCLLREVETSYNQTDDYSEAVARAEGLYQQVDELIHNLVKLCNAGSRQMEFILAFRSLEQDFDQVWGWIQQVGLPRLRSLGELDGSSLEQINKKQQDFKQFTHTADRVCRQGQGLLQRLDKWDDLSSASLEPYRVKVQGLRTQLQEFSGGADSTGARLHQTLSLYQSYNKAYDSALQGLRYLATISMQDCTDVAKCQAVIGRLESYRQQHPPIPEHQFLEMRALSEELRSAAALQLWASSRRWCQETDQEFSRKMDAALRTRDQLLLCTSSNTSSLLPTNTWPTAPTSLMTLPSSLVAPPSSHVAPPSSHVTLPSSLTTPPSHMSPRSSLLMRPCDVTPPSCSGTPPFSSLTPLSSRLTPPSSSVTPSSTPVTSPTSSVTRRSSITPPSYHETPPLHWRRGSEGGCSPPPLSLSQLSISGRCLRKTQSFDHAPTPLGPNPAWPPRRGNTGVHIKGLEVSSSQTHPLTPPSTRAQPPTVTPTQTQPPSFTSSPKTQPITKASKQQHIVEEMVSTEREYVRSLHYVTQHYCPEMERADLPQELRGQRCVVFGNLENILDFHSQFFLKELEACWRHPLRVAQCFLRHKEQFGLYALYSKNKPKSDALLASHGNSFFRVKQLSLGDRLDLASYLLKPIQRMSKYALLLKDLLKQLSPSEETGFDALRSAASMVNFQLRHGNDLLAMDAIRLCDVNLKEQGALLRQDRFTVLSGRRKSLRHVFLFEELLLFSKPKAVEGGVDLLYKHSFKTADLGLTESAGEAGLQFEVWFRKRWSRSHAITLQAPSPEVKQAWTDDITHLLWSQANRNKEVRMKEMLCMGVGSKPFLDIKASDSAISDRAVHYVTKKRGARTRASIAVSGFDFLTSDPNVSLLGALNRQLYCRRSSLSADSSFTSFCLEEDSSSLPSMTTENSSGRTSMSSGSDSGCISSHLHDAPANHSQV